MSAKIAQLRIMLTHFVRSELSNFERLLSPLLFSVTILILFSFAFGHVNPDMRLKVFVAQTFLTAFFALQIAFSRMFEPEQQDRAFDLMRTYPISSEIWFLAKYILVLFFGSLILFPTMFISAFFYQLGVEVLLPSGIYLIAFLALIGMGALGVLLSAMMLRADAKQILYPLIYFPLTTPVLLASVQASLKLMENGKGLADILGNWLGLLIVFDVIYCTLAILLYGELVKSD